ncbi:MAG: SDR family NAD(P)-dependent oxidoreductase [Dinghuibacter sp.]|nr:SDR family NAD(P)-dependent oxidoreductase [Dinghuibacter sp.]
MTTIVITGVSRGLGQALFEQLCAMDNLELVTLSRNTPLAGNATITNTHFGADFANLQDLSLCLSRLESFLAEKKRQVIFVSNAGDIGPVKKAGNYEQQEIVKSIHINYTAPVMIVNSLLSATQVTGLVNISSGAAQHPIGGWGMYCSTKAATYSFFNVVAEENPAIKVLQVDPGVIDTAMQQEIRNASKESFSRLNDFKMLKETNRLQTPTEAAIKVLNQIKEARII